MSPSDILSRLTACGVTVSAEDGRLVLEGRADDIAPDLVAEARAHHDELIARLRSDPTRCLHCLGLLEPHRVATCDACLLAQAELRRREVGR